MRAVIYARYSCDNQREESIDGQLRECTEFAKQQDLTIIHTYVDRALSASKETDKRVDFQRMIYDSAKGLFDVVLVWKLDRFARNRYDSAYYKSILKKNSVKVISATEHISQGAEGIILESILEGMAEYYSAELSEKIHRGQTENALKGKMNGGTVPLGYLLGEDKKLKVDPITAPIVVEVFERYAEGETVREIIESLNDRGLRGKNNQPYRLNSFSKMLMNRKYIGEYQYRDIIIPNAIPPLVSEDLFGRAQKRRVKNRKATGKWNANEKYILSTKLFCGKCGTMMAGECGKSATGKMYYYYKCGKAKRKNGCDKKAIPKQPIENLVVQQTKEMLLDDTLMESLIDCLLVEQTKENREVLLLTQQVKEVEKGIHNLLNAIQSGILTPTTKERMDSLEVQKTSLEKALAREKMEHPILTREEIAHFIYRFRQLDTTDIKKQEKLIDLFVNAIFVFDDRLILTFNYKETEKIISLDDLHSSVLCDPSSPDCVGRTSRPTQFL